jgi:hypothetical protein
MDLSESLQAVEAEIDGEYRSNPLLLQPRAQAAWALLSSVEEWSSAPLVIGKMRSVHDHGSGVDNQINILKYALDWITRSCSTSGKLVQAYEPTLYKAAADLIKLAQQYYAFTAVFEYWHQGELHLDLDGNQLITKHAFSTDVEYEAYNILMGNHGEQEPPPEADQLYEMIDSAVRIDRNRFEIRVTPKLAITVMKTFEQHFGERFALPEEWRFSRYTLLDFRAVYLTIFTLSALQSRARVVAIQMDCPNYGIADAVLITAKKDLVQRVARYSGVNAETVRAIFDDLEYGRAQQRTPDPAIQPLIPIESEKYGISPTLWLHTAPERNLCVLLNRIPQEREIYARLVDQKEALMRGKLSAAAAAAGYRVVFGRVPGRDDLGDVDVALVSDVDRECILFELKWFIAPAEIWEIRDRRKEILKGISQLRLISEAFQGRCPQLLRMLQLPSDSTLSTAVVSKEWIGDSVLQRQGTPVVMEHHLVAKLSTSRSLGEVAFWLTTRAYLPRRGTDFEVEAGIATVGRWSTEWYRIRGLIDHVFLPL